MTLFCIIFEPLSYGVYLMLLPNKELELEFKTEGGKMMVSIRSCSLILKKLPFLLPCFSLVALNV